MPRADRAIRLASTVTVLLVAGVACFVSYGHAVAVIQRSGGETEISAHLIPVCIDGLAASASLVMLFSARYKLPVPRLARFTLVVALGGTAAANILNGMAHGVLASVIAAWPALALVLSWEMAVWIVGASRSLETRTVVTITDAEHGPREQLAIAVEMIGEEPGISGAEVGRRLKIKYPEALSLVREARRLLGAE